MEHLPMRIVDAAPCLVRHHGGLLDTVLLDAHGQRWLRAQHGHSDLDPVVPMVSQPVLMLSSLALIETRASGISSQ